MKFTQYFLKNKALTTLLLALVLLAGVLAYVKMGKLEDAPFTIKQAMVLTSYPGASPEEVQRQVTDVLEESIQTMGELYYLKTENRAGLSKITVYVKKEIRADAMQQLWDKLRRKVNDAQNRLPEGAAPSVVNDDFGEVLGVFYALTAEGCSYRELEDQAKIIKNNLQQVTDVARVELYGIQKRAIEVEVNPSVMARSGITVADIASAFQQQNRVVDGGAIETDQQRIRIEMTGTFYTLDEIKGLTLVDGSGQNIRLSEIATVSESYIRPARNLMRVNNLPAIGIALSTVPTGNVVDMATLVKERMMWFDGNMPDHFELSTVYDQGHESDTANQGFLINLVVSVFTVVAILLFFIGLRNGIIVGSCLVFTIFATLIWMYAGGIALQRMSLAAIIIAMGMLVDNAIVVADAALVNMQKGMRKRPALLKAVRATALPLLAATVIGALTFLPVYLSPHITGELLSSVFIVIAVSLMFSWVFAIVQTPFYMQQYARRPRRDEIPAEPFGGEVYERFRVLLRMAIQYRYAVVGVVLVLLVASVWSFRFIPRVFMPTLDKQYFSLDMWMPEGTRIEATDAQASALVEYVSQHGQAQMVSSFVGQSAPRYYLSNIAFGPQSNYAQLLVKTHNAKDASELQNILKDSVRMKFPDLFIKVNKFELSPVQEAMIEARFLGPNAAVLDSLVGVAVAIMQQEPSVADARSEWRNRTMVIRPSYSPMRAGMIGVSKAGMMESAKAVNDGMPVGVYRNDEHKVPVVLRASADDQQGVASPGNLSVWNGDRSAPLSQLTDSISLGWEWPQMRTYNRQLSMAAMCGVQQGCTMAEVHGKIRTDIEAIVLPEGYSFFWDAQFKDQKEAMVALAKYFPLAVVLLILILVALFRNFKQPIIILCILPLSVIGVAVGMLVTGFDFGFFCMAGWLGLMGMIVKNVIVLLDEINVQIHEGAIPYLAIIEATVVRLRPVVMAAATTILGMIPLLFDVAFGGMAATIIFGLTFATFLTLFITPVLYAVLYRNVTR